MSEAQTKELIAIEDLKAQYTAEYKNCPTTATTVNILPGWVLVLEYIYPIEEETQAPPCRIRAKILRYESAELIEPSVVRKDGYIILEPLDARFEQYLGNLEVAHKRVTHFIDEYVGILTIQNGQDL